MGKPNYYVTSPVYDAATAPQFDFLYSAILCDAIARHRRNSGYQVANFGGIDMHDENHEDSGEPSVRDLAISVQRNHRTLEEIAKLTHIQYTNFGRIAAEDHIRAVQCLLRRTMRRSRLAIYKAAYEGRYCRYHQMDLSQSAEPVNCPICGRGAELISEERYYFRLSDFRDRLVALYKYHPEFVRPRSRMREIANLVLRGPKDIPISRRLPGHGVPWPDDPDHVVSACYSGLISYLSAIGFGTDGYGTDEFQRLWPANLHVVGRDALYSHAACWPAFLMAADLVGPRHVFAHPDLHTEHDASGNNLSPLQVVQLLGGDAFRFCLLREVAYDEDAHLSFDRLVSRYNIDLAHDLAGLLHRVRNLLALHCNGKIPHRSLLANLDFTLEISSKELLAEARFLFDSNNFSEGLGKIWSLLTLINKVLDEKVPRETSQGVETKQETTNTIFDACQSLGSITLFLYPVLPQTTHAVWKSFGQDTRLKEQDIDMTPWGFLRAGTSIGELEDLFPVVDKAHRRSQQKSPQS